MCDDSKQVFSPRERSVAILITECVNALAFGMTMN